MWLFFIFYFFHHDISFYFWKEAARSKAVVPVAGMTEQTSQARWLSFLWEGRGCLPVTLPRLAWWPQGDTEDDLIEPERDCGHWQASGEK